MVLAERPVRALRFTGFGLGWTWPLVNIVLEVVAKRGLRSSIRGQSPLTPTMANKEVWRWRDYKGRERTLVIEREVKEY